MSFMWIVWILVSVSVKTVVKSEVGETTELRLDASPGYVILASKYLKPSSVYQVAVTSTSANDVLMVKALVVRGKTNVASGSNVVDPHETAEIKLKIPVSLDNGQYFLQVEGYKDSTKSLVFSQRRALQYTSKFLTILVQSNRAVYNIGMEVKFRVILIQMDMKPYSDPVSISIKEPNGFIMRRWISQHSNNGVISIVYQLPALPRVGKWLIVVEAHSQTYTHPIYVDQYFLTQFELMVWTPVQVLHTESAIEGNVFTAFNPEKVSLANVTVRTSAKAGNGPFELVKETFPEWVPGLTFSIALTDIEEAMGRLIGLLVRVEIIVFEQFLGETRVGYSETKIIENKIKIRFLGKQGLTFRPGMPLPIYIAVSYEDDHRLPQEELEKSSLEVLMTVTTTSGQSRSLPSIVVPVKDHDMIHSIDYSQWLDKQYVESKYQKYRITGLYSAQITVPEDAQEFRLTARYSDDERQAQTTVTALPVATWDSQYIMLVPSNEKAFLNNFAIFQLKSNFYFEQFHYVVASKGLILFAGIEKRPNPTQKTTSSFSVPVSQDMVPSFTVVVYVITPDKGLLSHSATMPVDSFSRYTMNLTLQQRKDPTKTTVHMYTLTEPGSFIGFSLLRTIQYNFQAWNELSPSSVLQALHRMEPASGNRVPNVTWVDRDGQRPDVTEYFPAVNHGLDTRDILDQAGMLVITSLHLTVTEEFLNETGSCRSTGMGCENSEDDAETFEDQRQLFRIFRRNTYHDFYNWLDGDFAWFDVSISEDGEDLSDRLLPLSNEAWFLNAFSMHPELGFTMLGDIIYYDGTPPFYIAIECATKVRRGETVGVRIWIVNNLAEDITAILTLPSSEDYFFVEVEDHGIIRHYDPKLSSNDHQHILFIHPNGLAEVPVAIAPQIEQGTISVQVIAFSQMARQEQSVDIEILPEGVPMFRHLSLLLDLQNQANVIRFLDTPVEETPVIPYSKLRRYVYGSPKATVTVTGDVFGPVLSPTAVNYADIFQRGMTGLELHLFNLGATLWTLHYLRLTNKQSSQVGSPTLKAANVHLAGLTEYYNSDGSFRLFAVSSGSLWATAWALRIFGQTYLQDWENEIYIDVQLVQNCVQWILPHQRQDGSFPNDGFPAIQNSSRKDVPMTAHVLVALEAVVDLLPTVSRLSVSVAKSKAARYLERQLPSLKSAYEVALTTYSLTLGNHAAKEEAFGRLYQMKREFDEHVYWSNTEVPACEIQYENQKPFLQPKMRTAANGQAVESTAYALLVYLHREGITVVSHKIVAWLNSMRFTDAGFVSSFDTLMTMQAFTEYAFRARIADIADMEVVVDPSASGNTAHNLRFDSSNLLDIHQFQLENVWGHVNIFAKGVGQAVVQLHVEYGIDWEELKDFPKEKYFQLIVREYYSQFRNKSHVTIEACYRWAGSDPRSSSLTVLEIETPSGYGIIQGDANNLLNKPGYTMVKDIEVYQTKVAWFFEYVPTILTCFSYEVRRWYPVANLTQKRTAVIYESQAPERFEYELIDATPLYVLDVCEVCASYKCPYCPQYSGARETHGMTSLFLMICFMVPFIMTISSSAK